MVLPNHPLLLIIPCILTNSLLFHNSFAGLSTHRTFKRQLYRIYLSTGFEDCGISMPISEKNPFGFNTPNYGVAGKTYPPNESCEYTIVGNSKCSLSLSCEQFEMQDSGNDCADEYLEISDGTGNVERFCGNGTKLRTPIKSRSRYFFVKVQTGGKQVGLPKGYQCTVKCSNDEGSYLSVSKVPQRIEDFRCICGLQNKDDRIVGGSDAKLNEFPWLVPVVWAGTRRISCAGTIINNQYILSAGHCFSGGALAKDYDILIHALVMDPTQEGGDGPEIPGHDLPVRTDADENTKRHKVAAIIMHPFFTDNYDYDVALLKLEKKLDFSQQDSPVPICLPEPHIIEETYLGKIPLVAGWGLPFYGAKAAARTLQKVEVPVLDSKICSKWIREKVPDWWFCAGYQEGKMDACTGDSGGPLAFQQPNKQWLQIGIVSWGPKCAQEEKPGVYSKIMELGAWIAHNAKSGTWCRSKK